VKVFETTGIDLTRFDVDSMKGLKRTVRKFGQVLGHQAGVESGKLLSYGDARQMIYLPAYQWVLENKLSELITELKHKARDQKILLLDYETNTDIGDLSRPLSHAGLVKIYIEQGKLS